MSFWEKIKQTLRSFMNGRNGADHLSMALLWTGLIAYLLGSIVGSVQHVLFAILGMMCASMSTGRTESRASSPKIPGMCGYGAK